MELKTCRQTLVGSLVMLALFSSGPTASAQSLGDAARGQTTAERLCADCHAIEPGASESPLPGVATFETIAGTPGMTEIALHVWLRTTHNEMPNLILTPDERDDLVAYILSLRGR